MTTSTAPGNNSKATTPANRNIFEDPALAAAAKEDPVVRFVSRYWKPVIGTLIAIALGMIAYNKIQDTNLQKRAVATRAFRELREQYSALATKKDELEKLERSLPSKTDKEREELAPKVAELKTETQGLWEKVKLRADSLDSPPPFDVLSRLYRGLAAARIGDYSTAQSSLTSTQWEIVGRPGSSERMVAELAALGLARSLIDSDSHLMVAKATLKQLAERGEFGAVGAASSLASLATTDDEKKEVRDLIEKIKLRAPAQGKFLSEAVERVE